MARLTAVIADSVRLALPVEASQIAALQRRVWAELPELGATMLALANVDQMTQAWHQAIVRPPLAQHRVLVAVADRRVTGFAALAPSDDPDAEPGEDAAVAEFMIDPLARHRGHGSRLLNAVVDTLRADGFVRATWWVRATDDALRGFLAEAGWAPDGGHQEIGPDDGSARVKLVRLHVDIRA